MSVDDNVGNYQYGSVAYISDAANDLKYSVAFFIATFLLVISTKIPSAYRESYIYTVPVFLIILLMGIVILNERFCKYELISIFAYFLFSLFYSFLIRSKYQYARLPDIPHYYDDYSQAMSLGLFENLANNRWSSDPGFMILQWLISRISMDVWGYISLFYFINCTLITLAVTQIAGWNYAFIGCFLFTFYPTTSIAYVNILRQGLACSTLVLAIVYLHKARLITSLFLLIIAFSLHDTSIYITIPALLYSIEPMRASYKRKKTVILIVLWAAFFIFSLLGRNITIGSYLNRFVNSNDLVKYSQNTRDFYSIWDTIDFIIYNCVLSAVALYALYTDTKKSSHEQKPIHMFNRSYSVNIPNFVIVLSIMFFIVSYLREGRRFSYYGLFFLPVLIVLVVKEKTPNYIICVMLAFFIVCFRHSSLGALVNVFAH